MTEHTLGWSVLIGVCRRTELMMSLLYLEGVEREGLGWEKGRCEQSMKGVKAFDEYLMVRLKSG